MTSDIDIVKAIQKGKTDDFVKLSIAYLHWYSSQQSDLDAKRFIELYFTCLIEEAGCTFSSLYTKIEFDKGVKELFDTPKFVAYYFSSYTNFFPQFEIAYYQK